MRTLTTQPSSYVKVQCGNIPDTLVPEIYVIEAIPLKCVAVLFRLSPEVKYSTVQYSTVQYNSVLYCTVQYSTARGDNRGALFAICGNLSVLSHCTTVQGVVYSEQFTDNTVHCTSHCTVYYTMKKTSTVMTAGCNRDRLQTFVISAAALGQRPEWPKLL